MIATTILRRGELSTIFMIIVPYPPGYDGLHPENAITIGVAAGRDCGDSLPWAQRNVVEPLVPSPRRGQGQTKRSRRSVMNVSEVQDSGNDATQYVDDWAPGPIWWWAKLSPMAKTPSG